MGLWYTPRILVALRLASRFVDRYVANSQAVKRIVQEREHVAGKRISVIFNGYLPTEKTTPEIAEVTKRLGSADGSPIVGIVANLRQVKRIDTLIKAFGAIGTRFPDARLVIVGDCQSEQAKSVLEGLEKLATDLGVDNRVIFTGSVDDAVPYVSRFTVAVLCSESEGFSNALMEYMQAGRPIICTDTGGNPELVQDGTNGFLVPVGDVNSLADRLITLLSDKALAQRLGLAAKATVSSTYSHTRMITEQMACYDDVVAGHRSDRQFKKASGIVQ
jgi:glycosyltransferase involved in cell wall biosynthesis